VANGKLPGGILWDNEAPSKQHQFIPIISPRPHSRTVCVITSDTWIGAYTHFYDNRTRPCLDLVEHCEGCQRKQAKRWKAYLCGILVPSHRQVIIEITLGALDSCPALRFDKGQLRGKKITLIRNGSARNAPVCVQLETLRGLENLPQPFDLMESLCRVWGVHYEIGDAEPAPQKSPA